MCNETVNKINVFTSRHIFTSRRILFQCESEAQICYNILFFNFNEKLLQFIESIKI